MRDVRRHRTKSTDIQRQTRAQKIVRYDNAFRSQALKIFPAVLPMGNQEEEQKQPCHRAVFSQQIEIIVMSINRIFLHPLRAKFSAIIQVGAASGTEKRRRFPFFDRGLPEIEPDRRGIQRLLRAVGKVIALLNCQECGRANEQGREQTNSSNTPKQAATPAPQDNQTERPEDSYAQDGAGKTATAPGQQHPHVTNSTQITDEQFAPDRKATPTNQTGAENPEDFKSTSQVIRTNVKAACAATVIEPQKKQHEQRDDRENCVRRKTENHPRAAD